jgi:hypothetical protein
LGRVNFSTSRVLLRWMFYLGCFSAAYLFIKNTFGIGRFLLNYLKTFFNAKKYLNSLYENNQRYYAVIFGTGNRAGTAYA